MAHAEPPRIAALFQVIFDQKVGYTIAWKECQPGTDLDGVEYQCLPSGLHSVREDLVYFVHGKYAGVSAFVQREADEEHRNASFVAVGALIPLSYGRLGKSWEHAEGLRRLARATVGDLHNREQLEEFWTEHSDDSKSSGASSPTAKGSSLSGSVKRKRALSDATGTLATEQHMARDHPALSMTSLVTTFGPLLFPLYREALLRRRILVLGSAPVQRTCNFVYDLSILSNVPWSLQESVSTENGRARLQPLFNVGVSDITRLGTHTDGWLACTTDDILGEKKKLYDLLVELPPSNAVPGQKLWPKLRKPDGELLRATQRDLRRYNSLRRELRRIERGASFDKQYHDAESENAPNNEDDTVPLVPTRKQLLDDDSEALHIAQADIVQPETWSIAAYKSFMWWASAGEMDTWEADEASIDHALLEDLPDLDNILDAGQQTDGDHDVGDGIDLNESAQKVATLLVAYFHRVTEAVLQTLADNIEHADDDTEEGYQEDAIEVSNDDMRCMGVDPWNNGDRQFVQDVIRLYFNREANIEDDRVNMCGMRLC